MQKGQKASAESILRMKKAHRLIDTTGENNSNWKGGRWADKDGYILVYSPEHPYRSKDKRVREHRLVMEKHLGRYLKPSEKTHHLNGKTSDNRIENLILFKNNKEHNKCHRRNRNKLGQFA